MNLNDIINYYSDIVASEETNLSRLKKLIFRTGSIRLAVFVLTVFLVYLFWSNTNAVIGSILTGTILFLALMKYHSKLFKQKKYCEQLITNAENELKGINYNFSAFDGAPEKTDAEHSFSLDLDMFGNRSFFQSINRTTTPEGKDTLANMLLVPLENRELIAQRQQAIAELGNQTQLLKHFTATGKMCGIDTQKTKNNSHLFRLTATSGNSTLWKLLIWIVPAAYLLFAVLTYLGIINGYLFSTLYVATVIISSAYLKRSKKIMGLFDKKTKTLETYSLLFEIAENGKFESSLIKGIQQQLTNNKTASAAINELKKELTNLEISFTLPGFIILNPFFLWNVRYALNVEKWIQQHNEDVVNWFEAIASFDALISMGIFAFNHPDYNYPQINDTFIFEGKSLGHPMLNRNACVRNDISITKTPYFLVVTGANMAGKSTYLRTIGINHVLSCAGAPVCAESLKFYPGRLVTNLRTSDSLADNESYFFAELKRLKMIIDRLIQGEELFIILDEILKGTNSEDKQKGSLALIKQFLSLNGNGIIATHDLLLGTLQDQYPQNVKNFCFEADITDNQLTFTYKIREGIAQNMNACFLMKKMGITGLD